MGNELGNANYVDRLLVSSALYTNFHLDRERLFLELSYEFRIKILHRNVTFEISRTSRRDRVEFSNCLDLHMQYWATVSVSNFQVLTSSG